MGGMIDSLKVILNYFKLVITQDDSWPAGYTSLVDKALKGDSTV